MFRFALYLCGEQADAEDITAETFVRAWTAREPVRVATAKAYLLTIARNLHKQRARTAGRTVALHDQLRDPRSSPHDTAENTETLSAVLARLQTLPEAERAALLMSAVEGVPHDDIARSLGISLAAVKVKIHRARLKLADIRALYRDTPEGAP